VRWRCFSSSIARGSGSATGGDDRRHPAILTGVISFYEVTLLQAALDPFLVALTLSLLATRCFKKIRLLFFAAGLTAGLFVLNRPNAIVWIPAWRSV